MKICWISLNLKFCLWRVDLLLFTTLWEVCLFQHVKWQALLFIFSGLNSLNLISGLNSLNYNWLKLVAPSIVLVQPSTALCRCFGEQVPVNVSLDQHSIVQVFWWASTCKCQPWPCTTRTTQPHHTSHAPERGTRSRTSSSEPPPLSARLLSTQLLLLAELDSLYNG